ncbi:SDR family NAD(P)-dependent oxidoreductase [Spirosoma foliorum]|uniref:SDR family NAD(P)-dependent oxidoreductase n=1 Tax=Spirosoma foliorum TaxID=2710596 RepID=A0A7G5H516_9BACT|nr:SDR family NAD(P)-dependent oxidoreductase [Spirosoma foliorum]QMW06208.1 SDR family NAD(P)-dependent oxidoreductase [Spirosoma foliorum]
MQTIIITGATSGIGYECALELARMAPDKQLIIPCRNLQSGQKVVKKIQQQTNHQHVICMPLDLESLQSVREFVQLFSEQPHRGLVALLNNAGIQHADETRSTRDGFEATFGVNHLAPFYLTLLLLPFMSAGSSITFTASGTHDPKQTTGMPTPVYTSAEQLAYPAKTNESPVAVGQKRYTTSKLCNVLTTYALQKRIEKLNIRVNAFDPGFVPGTGLARSYSPFLKFISNYIFKLLILLHPNVHTARQSGKNLANLAYGDAYKAYTGKYFEGKKEIPSSEDSYRQDLQKELWETSLKLTGIKPEQTSIPLP